jgi:hypothetical protein
MDLTDHLLGCHRFKNSPRAKLKDDEMAAPRGEPVPRRVKELSAVIIICVLTVIGLVCASVGISVLPKCRYGAPDCYFIVEVCAYSDIGHAPPTPNSLPVSADGAGRRVISAADPCPLQTGIPGTSQMTQVKVKDGAKFKPGFSSSSSIIILQVSC